MVCNFESNEFLASLTDMSFVATPWGGQGYPNREAAKKARTQVRAALADTNPIAIDIVRVRADVRRGTRGRPRKIA
jgi:hypothetical protein